MRKLNLLLAVLALPVLFMACGGADGPAPVTTDDADGVIEVTIVNSLGAWDIVEVLIDRSDAPWGDNLLDGILEPGDRAVIEIDGTGRYDIRVTDEDGDTYTVWDVNIGANGHEWAVTLDDMDWGWDDEEVTITIENGLGSWDIWYIYACESDSEDWGEDRLGSAILAPRESTSFTVLPYEWYDFLVEDEDGDTYVIIDQYITEDFTWEVVLGDMDNTFAMIDYEDVEYDGELAPVTIHNGLGSWDIWYIYCSPTTADWGSDHLGSEILYAGDQYTLYVPAGGVYDIMLEDEDGDSYTMWEVPIGIEGFHWEVTLADID